MGGNDGDLVEFIRTYKSFTIIPDTSLDSLLAAGLLFKKLIEQGLDIKLSLNAKILVDYPSDPAIVIGMPALNKQAQISIGATGDSSITALITSMLDKIAGVDKWDKLMAILAGLYKGFYDFKSGTFRGLENVIMKELVSEKILYEVTGLRLWGAKRKCLVHALTRTLMPYIPGITGNTPQAQQLVSEVFKTTDPLSIRQKDLHVNGDKERVLILIKVLAEKAKDPQLAFKLLGDFYVSIPDLEAVGEIEAHELVGSLVVYGSLCRDCPLDIALISLEKSLIPQIMCIYEDHIDKVSHFIAREVDKAKVGEPVSIDEVLERPDIIVDVLSYANALPKNKVVKVSLRKEYITVLRELLRVGVKPEEAYVLCGDDQICPLK